MARWKPLTENQKRQMKMQVKHAIDPPRVNRTKGKLSRNNKDRRQSGE